MSTNLAKTLKSEKIHGLNLKRPLIVRPGTTLEMLIEQMDLLTVGAALIQEGGRPIGIVTEKDILAKVVEPGLDLKTPVERVMTRDPRGLSLNDSVADAIRLMNRGGYRHLPLVDQNGKIQGILSVRSVIRYLAEHFPCEVLNLPPDPHQVQRTREGA